MNYEILSLQNIKNVMDQNIEKKIEKKRIKLFKEFKIN